MVWQMREARQRCSAMVRHALDEGPQVVTRRGEAVVVVLAFSEYERLQRSVPAFADFLLAGPDFSPLDLARDSTPARGVEL